MNRDDLPITEWLHRAADGDRAAFDAAFGSLYAELKKIARARLHQQGHANQLETTALVHESFLRLAALRAPRFEDRRHFFAYAAKAMRHEIIDHARELLAERRGGGLGAVTLDTAAHDQLADPGAGEEVLRVHDALRALETRDPELAQIVEMRYFGGYSEREVGELLGVDERTVRRRWDKARAFLFMEIGQA